MRFGLGSITTTGVASPCWEGAFPFDFSTKELEMSRISLDKFVENASRSRLSELPSLSQLNGSRVEDGRLTQRVPFREKSGHSQ
jgi:hypothetical protein